MRKSNLYLILLSVLTVMLLVLGVFFRVRLVKSNHDLIASNQRLEQTNKKYQKHKDKVAKTVYYYTVKHGNAETKVFGQQYLANELLSNQANKLFGVIYTYNDSNQYLARKDKAKYLATDSILNNEALFGNGSKTSAKVVDTLNVQSALKNVDTYYTDENNGVINGWARVTYTLTSNSVREGTKVFHIAYDKNQNKFTTVEAQ